MQINICLQLSHGQNSHLGAKNIPYHTAMLAREAHSHTLYVGPRCLGPVGSPGVQAQI